MKIKISDVAEMAGVSRGTVDRVLHGRGHVDPEVEQRVLAILSKMDYKPSLAARQLSMRKMQIKLGLIARTDNQGVWANLLRGANVAAQELSEYGITVEQRVLVEFSPEEQLELIDDLVSLGVSGLAIVPLDDPRIRKRLNELINAGIKVILVNSEITGISPFCYVGSDYTVSGQTAAGLLCGFANGQPLKLAVLSGNAYLAADQQRVEGFIQEIKDLQQPYELLDNIEITSDSDYAYRRVCELLDVYPEINAIFTANSNVVPVCRAINATGRATKIIHVGYGMTQATRPFLLDGSLNATIGEELYQQGYLPFSIFLSYFASRTLPEQQRILMRSEIFIRQNCLFNQPYGAKGRS